MKKALLVLAGFTLGATIAAAPLAYKLQRTIEEKNAAVIVATNLLQTEPAAIEAACHQREKAAYTAAIAELTELAVQHPPLPAATAASAPQADSILMGLMRLLFR